MTITATMPRTTTGARCRRSWSARRARSSLFSLALTVFTGPLYSYSERAAQSLRTQEYVQVVLPEELR